MSRFIEKWVFRDRISRRSKDGFYERWVCNTLWNTLDNGANVVARWHHRFRKETSEEVTLYKEFAYRPSTLIDGLRPVASAHKRRAATFMSFPKVGQLPDS